jgi:hypothetical protein
MDRVTKAKIESLQYALRALSPGAEPPDVNDLATKYQLDPLIVQRVAESEGVELRGTPGDGDAEASDPRSPTGILDLSEASRRPQKDE